LSGLSLAVSGRAGQFALDVAFEAEAGITALFGPSGSGKTTVLRMIAGTVRPESGRIALAENVLFDRTAGVDIAPWRRRIGFVFQDGRLFPHLSVRRNLTYARWAGRRPALRHFDEVVALLGLANLLDRPPDTLSGGERQRVAIGRALLADPALLLMDEPLSSLDQARREDVMPYLEALRAETRMPIVYVSHEIGEVARLADTVVVLGAGRVLASGAAPDVFGRLDLGPALGGAEAGALVEGIVSRVDMAYALAEVSFDGGRLEVADPGLGAGGPVRLRVLARDVALIRSRPEAISVRNCIACVIEDVRPASGADLQVSLRAGSQPLSARITRKSWDELGFASGQAVYALIKAVAVDRRVSSGG
jgi:molybdate transport system ATP-binding protein